MDADFCFLSINSKSKSEIQNLRISLPAARTV
jgi:hypothetical protein